MKSHTTQSHDHIDPNSKEIPLDWFKPLEGSSDSSNTVVRPSLSYWKDALDSSSFQLHSNGWTDFSHSIRNHGDHRSILNTLFS